MKTFETNTGLTLTVREAEKSDASEILSFMKRVGGESDYLSFGFEGAGADVRKEEEFITRFRSAVNSVLFVGTIDGRIVTVAEFSSYEKSRFSHNANIGISVLKEFWGQGIGSIMMGELIDFGKGTNYVKNIILTVISDNERALALYKKFGFEETGRHKNFSKVGNEYYDATIMELAIK